MAWRVARSLDVLRDQLNAIAPRRDKAADGAIGDAAHTTRDSDHNPWYGPGVVTARDYTHDPAGGLDCHWLATKLVLSGDKRIKYIIWDGRIWSPVTGWRNYTGANAHTHHLHLSVVASPACDDVTPWALGAEDSLLTDERNALISTWAAIYGKGGAQGDQSIIDRLVEIQRNTRMIPQVVAAVTDDPDIDIERVAALLDRAVAEHTPSAEEIAAVQRPFLAEVVRSVLGEDNRDQADQIVDELVSRLANSTPEGN